MTAPEKAALWADMEPTITIMEPRLPPDVPLRTGAMAALDYAFTFPEQEREAVVNTIVLEVLRVAQAVLREDVDAARASVARIQAITGHESE